MADLTDVQSMPTEAKEDRYDKDKYRIRELWNVKYKTDSKNLLDHDPSVYIVEKLHEIDRSDGRLILWLPFLHMQPRASDYDYQVYYETYKEAEDDLVRVLTEGETKS